MNPYYTPPPAFELVPAVDASTLDPLVVARDGLLFLQTDDSAFTRLLVCDFAAFVVETERVWEVAV